MFHIHKFEYFDSNTTKHCTKCDKWYIQNLNGTFYEVSKKHIDDCLRGRLI